MVIREEEYTLEFGEECEELVNSHLEEVHAVEKGPSIDHISYIRGSQQGVLALITARDGEKLAGYLAFWIAPDTNHDSTQAQEIGFYLREEYRKGFTAIKMIKESEKVLKDNFDVDVVLLVSTVKKDVSPLFRYMKYREAETTYIKEI